LLLFYSIEIAIIRLISLISHLPHFKNWRFFPMLYFVATPIGNLKEITYRAVEVLKAADCVYAENPRHSLTLLNAYGIQKPVFEYQKFSEREKTAEIIAKLKAGPEIAVISDAGVPLISDPGHILVKALIEENLAYTIAGVPCAAISALILSGLDTSAFCMAGFLPGKKAEREAYIKKFSRIETAIIFYVSVYDAQKDLDFLYKHLGKRPAALVREISKKFESVIRFNLGEVPEFTNLGELVLIIGGYKPVEEKSGSVNIREKLTELIAAGADKKEAVKIVAAELGMSKSEIYKESIGIEVKA
jgi:16S rRNA (cytidine1402-2'-O)-methyltransferase